MTSQAKPCQHVTSEMCSVLRYTADHGCMAKVGGPWLGPAAFWKAKAYSCSGAALMVTMRRD